MCSAKGDSDCYAKRWLPLRLYEYFLTRLSALLFDRGCAVLNLSKEWERNEKKTQWSTVF